MLQARTGQRATALLDGRVFVTGGYDGPRLIGTSEIYDPRTDTWTSAAAMPEVRGDFAMTTLRSGKVLVAGGLAGKDSAATLTSIFYVPEIDQWLGGPPLNAERVLFAQAKLPNGDLLIIGGQGVASGTAERYDVRQGLFLYAGTLAIPRLVADAAALPDGRAIVTGGLPEVPGRRAHDTLRSAPGRRRPLRRPRPLCRRPGAAGIRRPGQRRALSHRALGRSWPCTLGPATRTLRYHAGARTVGTTDIESSGTQGESAWACVGGQGHGTPAGVSPVLARVSEPVGRGSPHNATGASPACSLLTGQRRGDQLLGL